MTVSTIAKTKTNAQSTARPRGCKRRVVDEPEFRLKLAEAGQ